MNDDMAAVRPAPTHAEWHPDDGASLTVVARARAWLRQALPTVVGRRSRTQLLDDTELLLSELVTNAVIHAGGVSSVLLRVIGKTLRVTVCDRVSASPTVRRPAADAEHGRGYLLVEALASRWGVDRRRYVAGKCVWLELPTTA